MSFDALLGLAVLENHPRLAALRGLVSIASALTAPLQRKRIERLFEIGFYFEPKPAQLEGDAVWNALERVCVMLATDERWLASRELEFAVLLRTMESLIVVLEEMRRQQRDSSAAPGVIAALVWLRELLFGRSLNVAERAVLRGLYERERHLRG
jgi:hypothetical protein